MSRSISQLWQPTIIIRLSITTTNFILKNLNIILIISFIILYKITVVCDEKFLKILAVDSFELLCSENISLTNAINSKNNLLKFLKPIQNFEWVKFNQFNNLPFPTKHPFSHLNIILYKDYINQVVWHFQLTHHLNYNLDGLFTYLSDINVLNCEKTQHIWKNPGLIHFSDVQIQTRNIITNNEINNNLTKHISTFFTNQNLNPHFFKNTIK